ncbi:MAG: hypothetical protein HKN68_15890, partial [Saprospiraceae bacterium]|nr:hypothetical protein [Saprospiraceae bacterium]
MAIGAKVEIWHDGKYQFYEHFLSRGYISSVSPIIHFGIGTSALIDSIKVTWPQQKTVSSKYDVKISRIIEFDESEAAPAVTTIPSLEQRLFVRRNDSSIYDHKQSDFIDFYGQQPSLPHKYSQIGPVMAKGDINGDGVEDLVIGATNQTPTTVLLNTRGVFVQEEFEGLTTNKSCPEADIAIVDIDNDGDKDILIVSGGYANENSSDYQHYLYKNNSGVFDKIALPIPAFPASVLRPGDFDQDGDIDVFIGARIRRGMFPIAESSYMLINENGDLKTDNKNKFSLGMVTDAVWSDYDNDGWKDLMITREWNSVVILKNNFGKLSIVENNPLKDKSGLWYSITAGDFDQDGDDDYMVGNLGKNHRFTVNENYPMRLYVLDLDKNGIIDPFMTSYWPDENGKMTEYPVNYLDELSSQSSFFRETFEDYRSFSFASADQILSSLPGEEKSNFFLINTTSSYLIWNDNGSFDFQELTDGLQISPITKTIVHDFNNDKYPDIIVGGNDYSYDISTGYYDANKGFVMLSNGAKQDFAILTPSESGLLLQGQIGSLQYFEKDSLIIAGFNRDKTSVFQLLEDK